LIAAVEALVLAAVAEAGSVAAAAVAALAARNERRLMGEKCFVMDTV
jgi:hypothetical protein